jgi:hypothetical protein
MRKLLVAIAMIAVLVAVPMSGLAAPAVAAPGVAIYDSTENRLPPNIPSWGFEATSTAELGDYITFSGTARVLNTVTVTMSDFALHSTYQSMPAEGYTHPITLNIYNVDNSGSVPAAGSLLATQTETFLIPWRPESQGCTDPTAWLASDGSCNHGFAFNITFDLSSLNVVLPDEVIFGIAYNTSHHGYSPLGVSGPYDSLNVGLTPAVSVGSQVNPGTAFVDSSWAGGYCASETPDGGTLNVFRRSLGTCWTGFVPAVQITATAPAPTSKDQCKQGGWQQFNQPAFKNQGDCIQFFNTGK